MLLILFFVFVNKLINLKLKLSSLHHLFWLSYAKILEHLVNFCLGTPPSWIEGKVAEDDDGDGEEKGQQIICLMSPEQK